MMPACWLARSDGNCVRMPLARGSSRMAMRLENFLRVFDMPPGEDGDSGLLTAF